jgi:hypothetical protein
MRNVPLRAVLGLIAVVAVTMILTTVVLSATGGYVVAGGANDVGRTATTFAGQNAERVLAVEQRGTGRALEASSESGAGGYISGRPGQAGRADAPDLVLGAGGARAFADVAADPRVPSSDLRLTSNDDVVIRIDRDGNEQSRFAVVDPLRRTVFNVDEDGIASAGSYRSDAGAVAQFLKGDGSITQGDLLVVRPDGVLGPSSSRSQPTIVGVAAPRAGLVTGAATGERTRLALAGVVPVKATLEGGPILPGDFLTSSSTAGHAMKATPVLTGGAPAHLPGTIVGRAMTPLDPTLGTVLVLIDLG